MTTANAQADEEMPSAEHDWSGFYVGATAGYGSGKFEQRDDWPAKTGWANTNGFLLGGTIGYNVQIDKFVLGVEGDLQLSNIDGTVDDNGIWTCIGTDPCTNKVNWFSTLRGRVGYTLGDFMPFVTGGLTYANVESSDSDGTSGTHMKKNVFGYTVGGGLEMALNSEASLKLEALQIELQEAESRINNNFRAANRFTIVRAGLNWNF